MPVVFDEVIANVEPLPQTESDDVGQAETRECDDSAEKAVAAIETHCRRALRLEAN
jgi:hypothetical protein